MFTRKFASDGAALRFTFEGRPMIAQAGDTVAAALLANHVDIFRESAVSDMRRGPYCLMGVCFECLVVIDGVGNRQACLIPVQADMQVEMQRGRRQFQAPAA